MVLKARSHTVFDRCASPGEIGWVYMLSTVFLDSSMVEHSAVNRRVVGSSPTLGVGFRNLLIRKTEKQIVAPWSSG